MSKELEAYEAYEAARKVHSDAQDAYDIARANYRVDKTKRGEFTAALSELRSAEYAFTIALAELKNKR